MTLSSMRVYLAVLLMTTLYAGNQIISKAAFNRGADTFVFTFYRTALGTIFLLPTALLIERKNIPPLSFKVSVKIFLQALCGMAIPSNLFGLGLKFSNSTPVSALFNLLPVTTFFLAFLFGIGLSSQSIFILIVKPIKAFAGYWRAADSRRCNLFGSLDQKSRSYSSFWRAEELVAMWIQKLLDRFSIMETINTKRLHGIMKTTGVFLCFAGVVVMAFYRGPELKPINHHYVYLYHSNPSHEHGTSNNSKLKWAMGVLFTILATTCASLWQVLQGPLLKEYPSKSLNAALQSVFGTFQTFIIALIFERKFYKWKMGSDIILFAALYSGVFRAGLVPYLQIWVIEKRGPVFLTMCIPITLVITFAISWTFFAEVVHLGSIIGAILMVMGLYNVLWGKSRERKAVQQQKQVLQQSLEPK